MKLLLDTGILGQLCHPARKTSGPVARWLSQLLTANNPLLQVILPEICDYELRRKLLHLVAKQQGDQRSLQRLNDLGKVLEYLPIDTDTLQRAADFWAQARIQGLPTAADPALDGDVILAAQASLVGGTVVTANRKHLARFVPTSDWQQISL
jgi:predicted nucleic acid-binding protein